MTGDIVISRINGVRVMEAPDEALISASLVCEVAKGDDEFAHLYGDVFHIDSLDGPVRYQLVTCDPLSLTWTARRVP